MAPFTWRRPVENIDTAEETSNEPACGRTERNAGQPVKQRARGAGDPSHHLPRGWFSELTGMPKYNCKPGDLAIVVNALLPENIGQIVEVLGPQTNKPFHLQGPGHVWQVRTVSGRKSLCYRIPKGGKERIERRSKGPAPDCRLRPIAGLKPSEKVEEDLGAGVTPLLRCTPRVVTEVA